MIICLCLATLKSFPIAAQHNEGWTDRAEEAMIREDGSGLPEEQCEEQQELLLYPINLNRSTRDQLESCGLFTSFQVNSIIRYREEYGNFFSVYELASLNGFRKQRLQELSVYMTVKEAVRSNPGKPAGSRILLYAGRAFTNEEDQTPYPGSPWKTSLRIKTVAGRRVSMGVAYEKDPGEKGIWGKHPEHLSAYIELKGRGGVEQVIVGSYRINNGLGLVQGSGLMHTPEGVQSRPLILSSLKPYAGAGESIIHQGAACKLNLGLMKLMVWGSLQSIDLSLGDLSYATRTDWSDHIRETGLHRTLNEQKGRNLAYLGSAGIQLTACIGKLNLGVQYSPEINGLTVRGSDSLQYFHGPTLFHGSSIQWKWMHRRLELYGELAPGRNNSSAFQGGTRFFINDFLSGAMQVHWYGAAHRETFASAFTSGSSIVNERGVLLLIHAEPYRGIQADLAVEVYEYPAPRTLVRVPSSGFRYRLTLHNGSRAELQWRFIMVKSTRQQTPSSTLTGIRPLTNIQNNRIDGRLVYNPAANFTWQSRLAISYTPGEESGHGHAALQQVSIRLNKRLRCTAQLILFNVPLWANRIYLYEPGLYQQFRFPVYNGKGHKLSLVASLKAVKRITLEGRGSILRDDKGKKCEAGFQLRLNF
ncbi:MAG: hypothetical protein GY790_12995 [Bacteroidetes bacterium]|nr:hypothetical protein [Bacteroidota bacterium]